MSAEITSIDMEGVAIIKFKDECEPVNNLANINSTVLSLKYISDFNKNYYIKEWEATEFDSLYLTLKITFLEPKTISIDKVIHSSHNNFHFSHMIL